MTNTNPRRNRDRGAEDEREVARRLGGRRHPANTGGPEDNEHDWLAIQTKGGKQVITQVIRDAMVSAKLAALGKNKLPCVALVDRRGTRLGHYVLFEMDAFAAWFGVNGGCINGNEE
jgi:hypothetical protein